MKQIYNSWRNGFDFFFATKWSHWTKLDQLRRDFIFNDRAIWLTRYLVSIPVIFSPFLIAYFMLDSTLADAQNGVNSTNKIESVLFGGLFISLFVYPTLMFALYTYIGIIKARNRL